MDPLKKRQTNLCLPILLLEIFAQTQPRCRWNKSIKEKRKKNEEEERKKSNGIAFRESLFRSKCWI